MMIKYLRAKRDFPLKLEGDESYVMKLWIDASFPHGGMRIHSGGTISLGKDVPYTLSIRK